MKNFITVRIKLSDTSTTFLIGKQPWLNVRSLALIKGVSAAELIRQTICRKYGIKPTLQDFKKVAGTRGVSKMIRTTMREAFFS
jgi:hypothetical protein